MSNSATGSFVNLNGNWINLDDVLIQNVSEDIFGEDVVEYKHEGKTYTAKVVERAIGSG
jgi:hypothetical protein